MGSMLTFNHDKNHESRPILHTGTFNWSVIGSVWFSPGIHSFVEASTPRLPAVSAMSVSSVREVLPREEILNSYDFTLGPVGASEIKVLQKGPLGGLWAASHLAVSVSAHSARVVSPVHHRVVLVAAPVPVVEVLVALLPAEVRAVVAVVHGHAFIGPVVFPGVQIQHSDRQDEERSPRLSPSGSPPSL